MFDTLFSAWFFIKQFSNDCNQMLGGERVTEENQLHHIAKYSQNLLVIGRLASFFALCW